MLKLILKNPTTNQYYSLSDNTLTYLPNNSPKNMILHGIEQGKEIHLDVPFTKHNYVNALPIANVKGKVFTQDIGRINTLNIKEVKESDFEPLYTWYETNMTSNTSPSPLVASASSEFNTTYQAWKAFNSTNINENDCWTSASGMTQGFLQIDFGSDKVVNCFRMTTRNYSGGSSYKSIPNELNVSISNNGIDFTPIFFIEGTEYNTINQTLIFTLDNTVSARYFRLNVDNVMDSTAISIGKLEYGYKRVVN